MKHFIALLCLTVVSLSADVFHFSGPFPIQRIHERLNEVTVELTDGSIWSIQSSDAVKVTSWQSDELIHAQLRKSFHWFKRGHKFRLYNHARQESAKAMIVNYGDSPLIVFYAYPPVDAPEENVPIYKFGAEGQPEIARYETLPAGKKAVLQLTDGSTVEIRDRFDKFTTGAEIYVGWDERHGYFGPFIMTGYGKGAVYTPVYILRNTL